MREIFSICWMYTLSQISIYKVWLWDTKRGGRHAGGQHLNGGLLSIVLATATYRWDNSELLIVAKATCKIMDSTLSVPKLSKFSFANKLFYKNHSNLPWATVSNVTRFFLTDVCIQYLKLFTLRSWDVAMPTRTNLEVWDYQGPRKLLRRWLASTRTTMLTL